MTKYKYYFRKPRSVIVKDLFNLILISGTISIAVTSPYFLTNLWKGYKKFKKYPKQKFSDAFHNLRRQGYVEVKRENHQIYISLTPKGKEKVGWMQIDALKIKKPKKWDRKWRVVIFDINEVSRAYREAFRGKLKELGFISLQKSVWICPFKCRDEIALLKKFFGLTDKEVRLIVAQEIGETKKLLKYFHLS